MKKEQILKAISELKQEKSRNFTQTFELIINLKNFDPKHNSVDLFVTMPFQKGTKPKIAVFAGTELEDQGKKNCDLVITESDYANYDVKKTKQLAQKYDYFIAQAPLMAKVAKSFGRVLGTRGKMPNPKTGCVVPPNANLGPLVERLGRTVRLSSKKATNLQCMVGKENMSDEEVAENVLSVYNVAVKALPNELQNVKKVQLKLTMSKPVVL